VIRSLLGDQRARELRGVIVRPNLGEEIPTSKTGIEGIPGVARSAGWPYPEMHGPSGARTRPRPSRTSSRPDRAHGRRPGGARPGGSAKAPIGVQDGPGGRFWRFFWGYSGRVRPPGRHLAAINRRSFGGRNLRRGGRAEIAPNTGAGAPVRLARNGARGCHSPEPYSLPASLAAARESRIRNRWDASLTISCASAASVRATVRWECGFLYEPMARRKAHAALGAPPPALAGWSGGRAPCEMHRASTACPPCHSRIRRPRVLREGVIWWAV
jgi:hypothetical protein